MIRRAAILALAGCTPGFVSPPDEPPAAPAAPTERIILTEDGAVRTEEDPFSPRALRRADHDVQATTIARGVALVVEPAEGAPIYVSNLLAAALVRRFAGHQSMEEAMAAPVVFLIRHPRRSLESRIRMVLKDLAKEEPALAGRIEQAIESKDYSSVDDLVDEERFPLNFTGWEDLEQQIQKSREHNIDYRIIVAGDFRSNPRACLEPLLTSWGLDFEEAMVDWSRSESFSVGGLDEQSGWYKKVEQSQGVLPEESEILPLEQFPARFREHAEDAERIYQELLNDPRRLSGGA